LHLSGFDNAPKSGAEVWALRPSRYPHDLEGDTAVLTQSTEKYSEILQSARQLYETEPDWVTFFREVMGVDGIVRRTFSRLEDLTAFEKSSEFDQIQKWLVKLREQKNATDTESEPTRVITVRLPKSMHEYLRTEAHDLRTSMNKLCISKLLQVIEQDLIPTERGAGGTPVRKPISQPQTQPIHQHQPQQPIGAGIGGGIGGGSIGSSTPIPFKSAVGF
jgi:hypothetical protein